MTLLINNLITVLNSLGERFFDYAGSMFIQSGVLIVLLLIVDLIIRKRVRATLRYWIWMLVFIKLILPPSLSLPTGIGYWREDILSVAPYALEEELTHPLHESTEPPLLFSGTPILLDIPQSQLPQTTIELTSPATPVDSNLNVLTWQAVVFSLWIVGVLVFSALLIQRIWFVSRLIAQSKSAENRFGEIFHQCRKQVGIRRPIELRLTSNVPSPAVCGFFRPVILMPTNLIKKLPQNQFRAVLIHELCHIKRGDLWINSVQTVLQIIYFYNPLVWLANLVVRRIREQAVDEMVLVTLGSGAKHYSHTLIDIAEMAFFRTSLSLRLISVVESKKALEGRIKQMLNRPIPKSAKPGILGLVAVLILGTVLLPMAKAQKRSISSIVSESERVTKIGSIQKVNLTGDDILQIETQEAKGFNYPFYLFIPRGVEKDKQVHMLIETNNSGTTSDDLDFHRVKAFRLAKNSYATRMASRLRVPLLVPTFPRPRSNWWAYTHALDIDTLEINEGRLKRVDLQLTAMIKYAQEILRKNGFKINDKVFMHGFSASAKFCNRYSYLHPEMVKAVAAGGVNGLPTLPLRRINEHELPFPIGITGIEKFIDGPFNEKAFEKVAHYIYMGSIDKNDTLPSRDAWREEEADIIKTALAEKMMPDRWELSQKMYRLAKLPAQLVTYDGVGHSIKGQMQDDLVKFFTSNSGEKYVRIKPYEYPSVKVKEVSPTHETGSAKIDIKPDNFIIIYDKNRGTSRLRVNIPNKSNRTIPRFKLRFHRGDPNLNLDEAGNESQGWHRAGPIEPGRDWGENTRDFHLRDGQYEFNVVLDFDNDIPETDENNNQATLKVKVENGRIVDESATFPVTSHPKIAKPVVTTRKTTQKHSGIDIKPADFYLLFNEDQGTWNLIVSIHNKSRLKIPKFKLKFYLGDPSNDVNEKGIKHTGTCGAGPLEPGKIWNTGTRNFNLPDGQYEFNVILDCDNSISEIDENNNQATLKVKIENGRIVDQSATYSATSHPQKAKPVETAQKRSGIDIKSDDFKIIHDKNRGTYRLRVNIPNESNLTIPRFELKFYRGLPTGKLNEAGGVQESTYGTGGPIQPGRSRGANSLGFVLSDGQYVFTVVLDSGNSISEIDEDNNMAALQVKVENGQIVDQSVMPVIINNYKTEFPTDSPEDKGTYAITLPNGATVELVGVCDWPEGGKRCWRPDGSQLPMELYASKRNMKGFIYKVTGPDDIEISCNRIAGANRITGSIQVVDGSDNQLKDLIASISDMEKDRLSTTVRIGVAAGPWKMIASHDGKEMTSRSGIGNNIVWSQAFQDNNGMHIIASREWHTGQAERIIAIDKDGKIHTTTHRGGSVASGKILQRTSDFRNLKLDQVKEFQYQVRPYQWVEFKNVSLKPGLKTKVCAEIDQE